MCSIRFSILAAVASWACGCACPTAAAPEMPARTQVPGSAAGYAEQGTRPSANPPSRGTTTADAIATHLRQPKLRLGHYSSSDGRVGFVFDRLGSRPKLRMDGTAFIIELEPRGVPFGQTDLVTVRGGVLIRLGRSGEVWYFRGNQTFDMIRDADSDPLSSSSPSE